MKQSMRARRMARHHKRMSKQSKLSLVSLMDIFTILVFFLMMNASDVQVLDNHKSVKLPESEVDTAAKENILLLVNNEQILLQGKAIVQVADLVVDEQDTLSALATELTYHASRPKLLADAEPNESTEAKVAKAITIMGDKQVPYALLKKIMQTCAEAGFTDVSLAVEQTLTATHSQEEKA